MSEEIENLSENKFLPGKLRLKKAKYQKGGLSKLPILSIN